MLEQKYGRIVNIGSSAGLYGNFGQTNYSAAKMGIIGLTHSLAREGEKYNVLTNCVVPLADSRMTETVLSGDVRELLSPSHITPMVLFLSHDSCTSNGSVFEIGAGVYSKIRIERSQGIKLGSKDSYATVEAIADNFTNICRLGQSYRPVSLVDSLQSMLAQRSSPLTKEKSSVGAEKTELDDSPATFAFASPTMHAVRDRVKQLDR
jgi:NAD(P)-dependent dehydrogenase (short-subunit alcohol dehydrogenase family)